MISRFFLGGFPLDYYECPAGTFKCKHTGVCITDEFVCDGDTDCIDGSDEDERNCRKFYIVFHGLDLEQIH